MYKRDPLSVRYDGPVHGILLRAARASRQRKGVQAWVTSTRRELRTPDAGGRSTHERAFSRSAYYAVFRHPLNLGQVPDWSLKLTWGTDAELRPSSGGRLARPVRVRLYPRSQAKVSGPSWVEDPELQSGGEGSTRQRF